MMGAKEILDQLDVAEFAFPMLDNGYVHPADTRLSIYRDDANWMMIIEVLGAYSPRVSGYDSFQNCLHLFGSNLHRRPGTSNDDFLYPVRGCPEDPLFEDEYEWFVKPGASCVMLRGEKIKIDLSLDALAARGIILVEPPRIDPAAVLRALLPEHRLLLLASEAELKQRNPSNLPLWLRLDEWHHPDLAANERPSQCETFQMLADAITSGDEKRYRPTRAPNTHWRNWPEGVTL
jgi:Family of unknown function (DUF7003)